MNILQAIDDPNLFKPWFKNESWAGWRAWLAALFGLPMTPDQLGCFTNAQAVLWPRQRLRVRAGWSAAVELARASSLRCAPSTSPRFATTQAPRTW